MKNQILLFTLTSYFALASFGSKLISSEISWKYENTPLKIELYSATNEKQSYISETKVVSAFKDIPITSKLNSILSVSLLNSKTFVLVIHNSTSEDHYFFAVPHILNPPQASAGHYFECLCNGQVFKIPAGKYWYRIVRLNLNKYFQDIKKFKIEHQIIGLNKAQALSEYKDKIYE